MRFGVTSTALGTGFVAAGVLLGAGSATAFAPQVQPDRIGAQLSHEETVALGAGPIPAITAMLVPPIGSARVYTPIPICTVTPTAASVPPCARW